MVHTLPTPPSKCYLRRLQYKSIKGNSLGTITLGKKETEIDVEGIEVAEIIIHHIDLHGAHIDSQTVWVDPKLTFERVANSPLPPVSPFEESN